MPSNADDGQDPALGPVKSGHRRQKYHVPDFVRWRVPGCRKAKNLRAFPTHSLGLPAGEVPDSVRELKRIKRGICRAAARLNKDTLLYKSKASFRRFLAACREAFRSGWGKLEEFLRQFYVYVEFSERHLVIRNKTEQEELEAAAARAKVKPDSIYRARVPPGPHYYLQPFVPRIAFRGHYSRVIRDERASLMEGEHIAYLLTMIEQTRAGFFDEETLDVLFGTEPVVINDWSRTSGPSTTLWWMDDAWYFVEGSSIPIKVPKMTIDPVALRRRLEAVLDSPPGIEIDLSDIMLVSLRSGLCEISS